jgi:protease I
MVDLKARGEAGAARSKRMTLWQSLKTDLRNAGAEWVDEEAVVDGKLVTRNLTSFPHSTKQRLKHSAGWRRN